MRHIAAGLLFLVVGSVPALPFPALAQPSEVAYQGELKEHGSRFSGTTEMKFAIVKGTQSLWSNDSTSVNGSAPNGSVVVTVIDGLFSVYLGASPMTPLRPQALADAVGAVLRVWVKRLT